MLAIVDPKTLEVIAKVPVGHDPHEVIASPDGALAYVTNYGHGADNTLAVVDLVHQRALPPIDLGALHGPHGLDYAGGKIWFTAEGSKAIGSYDPKKASVDWLLGTGQDRTHMIHVSADMTRIITTNVSSGTMSFFDLKPPSQNDRPPGPPPGARNERAGARPPGPPPGPPRPYWEQTLVSVGAGSEGFDLSPDGKEAWTADAKDGAISIVDVANEKLIVRLDANVKGANRVKFTLDGKWVLISTLGGSDLVVFDAAARKEAKRIPLGHGAAGILIAPDGARAFVACSPDDQVAVIDLKSMSVSGKIEPGAEPDGMAWAN